MYSRESTAPFSIRKPASQAIPCCLRALLWGLAAVCPAAVQGQLSSLPSLPWPGDGPVTVSFAPDNVEIGRYRNELFQHLNSQLGFPDWQIEILRALQTWARHADLRVALAPDSPRAFGVPGLAQGDPRFGDIRLGAFPQSNVLGNAVPFHPAAGSWAGDVFFDTSRQFYFHDWGSGGSSPADQYDLYSVALHETGNALGLIDREDNPASVMYYAYTVPRAGLHPVDMAAIAKLYGAPPADPHEPTGGNGEFATATEIVFGEDFPATLRARIPGRIQNGDDRDFYWFDAPGLAENCWLRLEARGRSLLVGRLTAYDNSFNELATAEGLNPIQNNAIKEITSLQAGERIYVSIDWSGFPEFEFGDYELVLDFNASGGAEGGDGGDGGDGDDGDDDDPPFFEAGDDELVDALYTLEGLVDPETDANNSFAKAVRLFTPPGLPAGTRYEAVSSLAAPNDVDFYRIESAADATGTLVVDLAPLGVDPAQLDLDAFSPGQLPLRSTRRLRSTGDAFFEFNGIRPGRHYFLRIRSRAQGFVAGNYLLLAQFSDKLPGERQQIEQAALNASEPDRFGSLKVFKTQLFRFELEMTPAGPGNQAAQVTIYSDTGRVELVTSVRAGGRTVVYVWLQAGEHHVRFTARTLGSAAILPSIVKLYGNSVSDDEGPLLLDLSGNPVAGPQLPGNVPAPPPQWVYPVTTTVLYTLVVPPDNPWY
jgi:Matrixin